MRSEELQKRFTDFNTIRGMLPHDISNILTVIHLNAELIELENKSISTKNIQNEAIEIEQLGKEVQSKNFPNLTEGTYGMRAINQLKFYESILKNNSKYIKIHAQNIREYCKTIDGANPEDLNAIKRGATRAIDIADTSLLATISKKEIIEASTFLNTKELFKELVELYTQKTEGKGIPIQADYTHTQPIYLHKGVVSTIINATLANAYEYTLGPINLHARNGECDLEFKVDNTHNNKPQRETLGEKKGKGLSYIKRLIEEIDGTYFQKDEKLDNQIRRYSTIITIPSLKQPVR